MRNKSSQSMKRKFNVSHDSCIKNDIKKQKRSAKSKRSQWNQVLKEISHVTNKVKRLYDGQTTPITKTNPYLNKKQNSLLQKNLSANHSYFCHDPLVNCFDPIYKEEYRAFIKQERIHNECSMQQIQKGKFRRALSGKQILKNNRTFEIGKVNEFDDNSYLRRENVNDDKSESEEGEDKYEELKGKFEKLSISYQILKHQKQCLLHKIYQQNKQNQQIRNKDPASKADKQTRRRATSSMGSNKQNMQIKTQKKRSNASTNSVLVNRAIQNSQNFQLKVPAKQYQSSQFCSFSDAFTSKCLDKEIVKKSSPNKTESLLIDLSNRSSTSNGERSLKYSAKNFESVGLQKELISLLQMSKFEKDINKKQNIRMRIYRILQNFGLDC